jgi:hypothetical protein
VRVVALIIALTATAQAHGETSPLSIDVAIDGGKMIVTLRMWIDDGAASRELREHFDRDANGKLDDAEQAALGDYLIAQSTKACAIDGVTWKEIDRAVDMPDGASAHVAAAARYEATISLPATLVIHAETKSKQPTAVRVSAKHAIATPRIGDASPKAPLTVTVNATR